MHGGPDLADERDLEIEVALVVPRTEAEGPGVRYAIWAQGCPFRCKGCCNPEFLEFRAAERRRAGDLVDEAIAAGVEGLSLLGGEPFAQADALAIVAEGARAAGLTVMIYSGYTIAELRALPGPGPARLLAACDLLVDGRYEEARRSDRRRFIGSDNQVLHVLSDRASADDPRLQGPQHLEIRLRGGVITINGWPTLGARTRVIR